MVDSFYLEMTATFTFLQGMVEWLEIHLENLEMPRTSKMITWDLKTYKQLKYLNYKKMKAR